MKSVIIPKTILLTLLRTGVSHTSKFKLEDLSRFLPGVYNLLFEQREWGITAKSNDFWKHENNGRRSELQEDIVSIRRTSVRDGSYFHILNRLTNGDRYGISNS